VGSENEAIGCGDLIPRVEERRSDKSLKIPLPEPVVVHGVEGTARSIKVTSASELDE
jgi:hypothetical protein